MKPNTPDDASALQHHGGDRAARDRHEAALVAAARAGDESATAALWKRAELVAKLAVRKHLNGCQNDGAEADALAACKVEFMKSIAAYDPERQASIRTLWFLYFRRAVVGYVRSTARHTRRVFCIPATEAGNSGGSFDGCAQEQAFRGAASQAEVESTTSRMQMVRDAIESKFDPEEARILRLWLECGGNSNETGRLSGSSPRVVSALVQRLKQCFSNTPSPQPIL